MDKNYIPGRGRVRYSLPEDLYLALERADVQQIFDEATMTFHFVSRNALAPLTDKEKDRLRTRLWLEMCPYEIVFDN